MRIRVSAPASIHFQEPDNAPDFLDRFLNDAISEESCLDFLDAQYLSFGLSDGRIRIARGSADNTFDVVTVYDCAEMLSDPMIAKLVRATTGQWSDGLGMGCFQDLANEYGATIDLAPLNAADEPKIEISRTPGKPSSPVAKGKLFKAASDGDCKKIQEFLDAGAHIDEELQSTTPLGMAILGGHVDAAKLLLKAGADPQGPPGESMLLNAALSNVMTDADAAEIARDLSALGADPNGGPVGDEGDMDPLTPLFMAQNREKLLLAQVLVENGAHEA